MKKKLTCVLLFVLMISIVLGTFSACSSSGNNAETTAPDETKEEIPWLDDLPKAMDYNGLTLRGVNANWYMAGDEVPKEVVSKALYDQQRNVAERMNIDFAEFEHDGYGEVQFRTMIESNLDECDFVLGCGAAYIQLCLEGYFIDMAKQDEFSVISLDKEWWAGDYTKEINAGNFIFWLKGEATMDMEDHPCCLFVNNSLYPVVVGASDPDSEDGKIYKHIKNGTWTLDTMIELVRDAYVDDGDGALSPGDRTGFKEGGGVGVEDLARSAGAYFTKRDDDNIPYAAISNETNVAINEKLYDLMHLDGASAEAGGNFSAGNLLFYAESADAAGAFRDMKDDWTMIPMPKLNEDQEKYRTALLWATSVLGIPVTASDTLYEAIFNLWEITGAEYYRSVRPAILDEALKNKYSRDEETKEMVDLITAGATTDFAIAYGGSTGMSSIFRDNCVHTRDIASILSRREKGVGKVIDKIILSFENVSE